MVGEEAGILAGMGGKSSQLALWLSPLSENSLLSFRPSLEVLSSCVKPVIQSRYFSSVSDLPLDGGKE